MTKKEKITLILNKTRLTLLLIVAVGFLLSGCVLSTNTHETSTSQDPKPSMTTMHTTGQGTSRTQISPTPTPTAVPTPTPSPMPTATPTPTPKPTPIPTPTPPPTPTPTPKPTPTAPPSPTPTVATVVTIADGFSYEPLDSAVIDRITGVSYPADPADSQVAYADLRYIRLRHYTFEGDVVDGELIVNTRLAKEVTTIFHELYKAKYPLASVRLVDDYDADDRKSMTANNTSAFNYRFVSGTTRLSLHAYGAAIDINPVQNPYVYGDYVSPENGLPYADRTQDFVGKIDHDDLCYRLFTARGWTWGGDWKYEKDYQHFQKRIG